MRQSLFAHSPALGESARPPEPPRSPPRRARAPPTASPASLRGRRMPWTRQPAPNGARPRPAGLIPTSTRPSNSTSQRCCCLDNPPREFTAAACDGIGWPSSLSPWFLVYMCMRSCHPAVVGLAIASTPTCSPPLRPAATGDGSGGAAAVGLAIASTAQSRGIISYVISH